MNRRPFICLAAFVFAFALAQVTTLHAATDRHVLIVCIDGFAAYLLNDPKAPVANLRKLAKNGAVAEGGMRVSNPSVTWPNHTSIVSGVRPEKHGVLANGVLVRGAAGVPVFVDPKKEQADLVRVATLFDLAHAQGLTTAEVNWPCTRSSKSFDDSLPDAPEQIKFMTPRLRDELISQNVLADATDKTFMANSPPGRDLIWTETARHILLKRKPNLMAVHLLNVDSTHHAEGAQSPAGYTANAYADMCLGRIVAAVDEAGIRDKTTIIVVADHGFTLTPKAIRPNVVLRQNDFLTAGTSGKITEARVHVVPEGGIGLVYFIDPGLSPADQKRVETLLAGTEGVAEVLAPTKFAEYGLPHPREYPQAPNLVIVAKDGYAVTGSAEGEAAIATSTEARFSAGSHGFISKEKKMNAVCVLSGAGIKPGVSLQDVENIDLAPTIAKILDIQNLSPDGHLLTSALISP
jgi:arylsulfatase A-like enzyme